LHLWMSFAQARRQPQFGGWGKENNLGTAAYVTMHVVHKMIAAKMVFVDLWGAQFGGSCPQSLWLRAYLRLLHT